MGGSTGTQPTQPLSSTATPAQALASVATNKGMQPSSPTATPPIPAATLAQAAATGTTTPAVGPKPLPSSTPMNVASGKGPTSTAPSTWSFLAPYLSGASHLATGGAAKAPDYDKTHKLLIELAHKILVEH